MFETVQFSISSKKSADCDVVTDGHGRRLFQHISNSLPPVHISLCALYICVMCSLLTLT